MRRLDMRTPRIVGLLALMLGAVALLAVSGVAMAKDHGHDDNGGHQGHHHHHGRHHDRQFEMREAGTIAAFDATTGKLTITLLDGGTVTGLVTENTEIRCEGIDNRLDRRDHGGGGSDNSGPGSGGENGGHGNSSGPGNGGQNEPGDNDGGRGEPQPGDDNGGEMPPVGAPAPEGEASCSVASLVPGAVVGDAELRLEGGSAFFEEVELGHDS